MLADKRAFEQWSKTEAGYCGPEPEAAWHAALAWLRSQGEPVTYAVLDSFQRVVHTDSRAECHEHINDAINQFEIYEAAEWIVRPIYLAPQPAIPDGWRLVPVEPTEKMCLAYTKHKTEAGEKWARHQWAAMLAAAPEPKSC